MRPDALMRTVIRSQDAGLSEYALREISKRYAGRLNIVFFTILVGYSILRGKKGEIPIGLENPHADKRRPDVGSMDSRIMPRNGS
jgi:hypothetical protein